MSDLLCLGSTIQAINVLKDSLALSSTLRLPTYLLDKNCHLISNNLLQWGTIASTRMYLEVVVLCHQSLYQVDVYKNTRILPVELLSRHVTQVAPLLLSFRNEEIFCLNAIIKQFAVRIHWSITSYELQFTPNAVLFI